MRTVFSWLMLVFSVIGLTGCEVGGPMYAPWPAPTTHVNTADGTALSSDIAMGKAPHHDAHEAFANHPRTCVTNPQTLQTVCTLVDP